MKIIKSRKEGDPALPDSITDCSNRDDCACNANHQEIEELRNSQ